MAARGHHRDVITAFFVVVGVVGSLGCLLMLSSGITTIGIVGFVAGFIAVPLAFALLPDLDLNELGFAAAFASAFAVWAVHDMTQRSLAIELLVAVVVTEAGVICAMLRARRWSSLVRTRRLLAAGAAGTGWAVLFAVLGHRAFAGPLLVFPVGVGVVLGGAITTAMVRELDVVHSAVGQIPWLLIAFLGSYSAWFGVGAESPRPATVTEVLVGAIAGGVLFGFIGGGVGAMFGNALRRKPKAELPEARQID